MLLEQTTPTAQTIVDHFASVSNIVFPDQDLDASQIGGTVQWTAPADQTYVVEPGAKFLAVATELTPSVTLCKLLTS